MYVFDLRNSLLQHWFCVQQIFRLFLILLDERPIVDNSPIGRDSGVLADADGQLAVAAYFHVQVVVLVTSSEPSTCGNHVIGNIETIAYRCGPTAKARRQCRGAGLHKRCRVGTDRRSGIN